VQKVSLNDEQQKTQETVKSMLAHLDAVSANSTVSTLRRRASDVHSLRLRLGRNRHDEDVPFAWFDVVSVSSVNELAKRGLVIGSLFD
jgi:hypothetical protein